MAMNDKITAIRNALTSLGIKNKTVSVENIRDSLSRIFINGSYFGTFDCALRTFVD